jgi:hypothetical protein
MGINIAKELRKGLKAVGSTVGLRAATLVKQTPGTRSSGNLSAGTNPTSTSYPCEALIEQATAKNVGDTLVAQAERFIGIIGASLPKGIVPIAEDRITLVDIDKVSKTFRLVAPVSSDGVGAMYEFAARK